MFRALKDYMEDYWEKYPAEKLHDPSIEEIYSLAKSNEYKIDHGFFCIYTRVDKEVRILFYCFDFQNNLRKTFKAHKDFTKNNLVFLSDFKDIYKRNTIAEFDEITKRWRFL